MVSFLLKKISSTTSPHLVQKLTLAVDKYQRKCQGFEKESSSQMLSHSLLYSMGPSSRPQKNVNLYFLSWIGRKDLKFHTQLASALSLYMECYQLLTLFSPK